MLHGLEELRVFLPHDLVELRGPHPGLLHLLKGSASIDSLMLPRIPDDEYTVLRLDLGQECPHLLGRCQRGLIEHIEVAAGRIARRVPLAATGEVALEGGCADSGLPELCRCSRRGGESLDRVTALFRSFADARKDGRLAGPCQSLK